MTIKIELTEADGIVVVAADIADFVSHFSENLSPEGVLLETELQLERGREWGISMRLEDGFELVKAVGMVAWQRDGQPDSAIESSVALHILRVESGADFLKRIASEHEAAGGLVFSVDRAAPMTQDGGPLAPDALDQMMARRGDLSGTAELEALVAEEPIATEPTEAGPEFAPGFGQSDMWDSNVAAEIPGQVNDWLAEEDVVLPPVPPTSGELAGTPTASTAEVPSVPWPPKPTDAVPTVSQVEDEPRRRSGPIKMKLAADRQPSSRETETNGNLAKRAESSSFVEASRKATELISESTAPPMPTTPADLESAQFQADAAEPIAVPSLNIQSIAGPDAAVATVAIKPGEIAKMMERAEAELGASGPTAEAQHLGIPEAGANERMTAIESSLVTPLPTELAHSRSHSEAELEKALLEKTQPKEPRSTATGSQLSLDSEVLKDVVGDAPSPSAEPASSSYDFPEEDKTPMLVIGIIVAAIVVAIVVWTLVS